MSATIPNQKPGIFSWVISSVKMFIYGRGPGTSFEGEDGTGHADTDTRLYDRLLDEAASKNRDIRKISVTATEELADQLIALMFDLRDEVRGYQGDYDLPRLLRKEADERSVFRLPGKYKVFYTYHHKDAGPFTPVEISRAFYDRIFEFAGRGGATPAGVDATGQAVTNAVKAFAQGVINAGVEQSGEPRITFDPDSTGHQNLFRNGFVCHFAVCPKNFPDAGTQFIVGRRSIYDLREINQKEYQKQQEKRANNPGGAETTGQPDDTKVCIAFRYRPSDPPVAGSRIRFNAHRFRSKDDELPQPELELLISDVQTTYPLSAGFAEHDEIYCADWEKTYPITLSGIRRGAGAWICNQTPKTLPEWLAGVTGSTMHGLYTPLLLKIRAPQVQPKIRLISRVLRRNGINDDTFDASLGPVCESISPVAAIKITEDFWVVLSSDGAPRKFVKSGTNWDGEIISENERFEVNGCRYFWKNAENDEHLGAFSERYAGLLAIEPMDLDKKNYERDLVIDSEAESLPVADDDMFLHKKIVNDKSLGSGTVFIKCTDDTDNRGQYAFLPARRGRQGAVNPFFAVKRVVPNNVQPWPEGVEWISYDPNHDEHKNNIDEAGFLAFKGKERILAVRSSYLLFCGECIFQIEISGTPGTKDFAARPPAVKNVPELTGGPLPVTTVPEPVAANEENVVIALQGTEFEAFSPRELSQSNIALHISLEKDGSDSMFLKAFWPYCRDNAERETGFYEQYGDRATELFIKPPVKVVPNDNSSLPYVLVFEKLEESTFSALHGASIPQAVALGYSLAVLQEALSEDGLVNYDIDATNVCFERDGRICLIDFDNVFPLVNDQEQLTDNIKKVGGLLKSPELPAKNDWRPPEAEEFKNSTKDMDKAKALMNITSAYGVYLIGATLLALMQVIPVDKPSLTLGEAKFNKKAKDKHKSAAKKLKPLLKEMIRSVPADRPSPRSVVERLAEIISLLAEDGSAKDEMEKMLGAEQLEKIVS